MREVSVTEARAVLSELVSQVAYGGDPVVLTRHGKALVVLVPVEAWTEAATGPEHGTTEDAPVVLDLTGQSKESRGGYGVAAHHRSVD